MQRWSRFEIKGLLKIKMTLGVMGTTYLSLVSFSYLILRLQGETPGFLLFCLLRDFVAQKEEA